MTRGCNVQYSLLQWKVCISSWIRYWLFSVKSPSIITSFAPSNSYFDFTDLAWAFAMYECQVRLLMLLMRSYLYSSNVVVSVASAARSVVYHWQWNPYPDDWAHHPGTFSNQHFLDMTHSNASCTPCYLGHRQISWLSLCIYTASKLHQPAILHSDECYICKQNECLMIQQGQIILVLECKTWKIRFLYWDICLWMHCTVLIDCTEPIALVCAHFDQLI